MLKSAVRQHNYPCSSVTATKTGSKRFSPHLLSVKIQGSVLREENGAVKGIKPVQIHTK